MRMRAPTRKSPGSPIGRRPPEWRARRTAHWPHSRRGSTSAADGRSSLVLRHLGAFLQRVRRGQTAARRLHAGWIDLRADCPGALSDAHGHRWPVIFLAAFVLYASRCNFAWVSSTGEWDFVKASAFYCLQLRGLSWLPGDARRARRRLAYAGRCTGSPRRW